MLNAGLPFMVSTQRMQSLVTQTREDLDVARVEAVTSRVADIAQATNGDIGRVQLIEKQIADLDAREANMNLLKADFSVVNQTLDDSRDRAASIATQLDAAVGQSNQEGLDALKRQADSDFRMIVATLNTSFGGRQLFSGAKNDTPPLPDADAILSDVQGILNSATSTVGLNAALNAYFDDPAGAFQTTVYQGSTTAAPDRDVGEARRIGIDVKATDPGLRDILKGLAMAALADPHASSALRENIYTDAASHLRDGAEEVVSIQSKLGAQESEVDVLLTRTNAVRTTYVTSLNELTLVDQYEAASRMTALETQLEAVYLTTSRISSLSLVNFLR